MKGDQKVIEFLNIALKNELTAINQYFLHSKLYADWGFKKLADFERAESIDEMKHADVLIDRILLLEGLPNLQDLGKLLIGQNVKECLECDLKLEYLGRDDLVKAIEYCVSIKDYVSKDLFETILEDEEGHIDHLETDLSLIEQVGLQNYLQSQI